MHNEFLLQQKFTSSFKNVSSPVPQTLQPSVQPVVIFIQCFLCQEPRELGIFMDFILKYVELYHIVFTSCTYVLSQVIMSVNMTFKLMRK
jgi:hypothetical protein